MQHIIDELNRSASTRISHLLRIHRNLIELMNFHYYSSMVYDSDLYEVLEFNSLLNYKWGSEVLGTKTIELIKLFNQEWKKYRTLIPQSDDGVFCSLDPGWHKLFKKQLLPALESMEADFDANHIEYNSYKKDYNPDARPGKQDILERGRTLYGLLLKHNVKEVKFRIERNIGLLSQPKTIILSEQEMLLHLKKVSFRSHESYSIVVDAMRLKKLYEYFPSITDGTMARLRLDYLDDEWRRYIQFRPYGIDGVFVWYDDLWKQEIEGFVKPCVKEIEDHCNRNDISFNYDFEIKEYEKPEDNEIVERGNYIYGLLLREGIVTKSYLK